MSGEPQALETDSSPQKSHLRTARILYWGLSPTIFLTLVVVLFRLGTFWLPSHGQEPPDSSLGKIWALIVVVASPVSAGALLWLGWKSLRSQFK